MYISGQLFNSLCVWSIDNRYPLRLWDSDTFKEGDSIFLKVWDIPFLLQFPPPKKAVFVIHNSDEPFTDALYALLNPMAITVYAANCQARDAIQIPLGFRDDNYTPHNVIDKVRKETENVIEKDILCLVNFSLATNIEERTKTLEFFKNKAFCTVDGDYFSYQQALNFSNPETITRREEFYKSLARSRFVICPAGTGVDTHRVYESIIFGAIPIVKTSFLDALYSKLPVVIVNNWGDVTEEFLLNLKGTTRNQKIDLKDTRSFLPIISFVTYADQTFEKAGVRIVNEAKETGIFGYIKCYNPTDLDESFTNDNKYLLSKHRGAGYWCWKSYVILKTMEKIAENSWILYADAGCTLIQDRKFQVIDMIRKMEHTGKQMSAYQMPHLEKTWTKGDMISRAGIGNIAAILETGQYVGGVFLIKNTEFTRGLMQFIKTFIKENPTLIDDSPSLVPNDPTFIEHRHDQSLFSILRKCNGDKVFVIPRDETWRGNDFVQATRKRE